MELDSKQTIGPNTDHETFGLEFLNAHIETLVIRVAEVQKDFLEHYSYKIEFLIDDHVVYEVCRRYTEFGAFYEMLEIKFKNLELDSFPSKWQLFKKITNRIQYFHNMMNTLLSFAKNHPEARQKILSCILSFVNPSLEPSNRRKSNSIESSPNEAHKVPIEKDQTVSIVTMPQTKDPWEEKVTVPKPGEATKQVVKKSSKQEQVKPQNKNSLKVSDAGYQYFEIRFEGEYQWRKRYLKVNGSSLEIYKDITRNTWQNKIELYRAKIQYLRKDPNLFDHFMQKLEFQLEMPVYPENTKFLTISHQYDCKKFIITTPEATEGKISDALRTLSQKLSMASYHNTLREDYQGYFGVIGKIYFVVYNIAFISDLEDKDKKSFWIVRLKTSAFTYDTKQVQSSDTQIKQGIIIPISNSFEKFKIELVRVTIEGVITEEIKQTPVASATILMNDLLSSTNDTKFEKKTINLYADDGPRENEVAQIEVTIRNMSDNSSIYSDSYANANDGRIITYEKMSNREIVTQLGFTIDRLLYVVGAISLFIQTTWRNIYFFKYPRLASLVFGLLGLAFLFSDMNNMITFLVIWLCLAIVYNHRYVHSIVNQISKKYLTNNKHLHPDFKTPLVLGKSEFQYLKWSGNLELIKTEIDQENKQKGQPKKQKGGFFYLKKGDNEFKIEEEKHNLYERFTEVKNIIQKMNEIITTVVAFFEKTGSLYTWADFRRTLYFLILIIFAVILANAVALRLIGFLFCLHRFKKSFTFYKRHYARNRHLASSVLNYIVHKNFRELLTNLPNDRVVPIEDIYCPIEADFLKKIKKAIETLIPIKMNTSDILEVYEKMQAPTSSSTMTSDPKTNDKHAFISSYINNKKLRIGYFVDLIETCESRLKLERLITAEGRSDNYQRLREQTKECPVIDIWIEDLVRNYLANIPSQLYTIVHREDHRENNLFGKDIKQQPIDDSSQRILCQILENSVWTAKPDGTKKTN